MVAWTWTIVWSGEKRSGLGDMSWRRDDEEFVTDWLWNTKRGGKADSKDFDRTTGRMELPLPHMEKMAGDLASGQGRAIKSVVRTG